MDNCISIDFNACDVNVSSTPQVVGLPTMAAIDGYAHNIEREFGLKVVEWSIAYRRCDVLDGHQMVVNYENGHKDKKSKTPYILDRRLAQVEGFLILYLDEQIPLKSLQEMRDRVEALRFSGGTVTLAETGVQSWKDSSKCLRHISRSYIEPHFLVEDRSELLLNPPEGLSKIDWLMDLVARPKTYKEKETVYAYGIDYQGYLTPIVKGYKLLEAPREREFVRGGYPHAYAEPIIGVARMRSLPSVIHALEAEMEDAEPIRILWAGQFNSSVLADEYDLSAASII